MTRIVTHPSRFHADDLFAVTTVQAFLRARGVADHDIEVVRTRDPDVIASGDYVLDVGGEYDPERGRFDHHQEGGAGTHPEGVWYAAFGLTWDAFGVELAGSAEAAEEVRKRLVRTIDANDNGHTTHTLTEYDIAPYTVQSMFFSFGPSWQESDRSYDDAFFEAQPIAEQIVRREIEQARAIVHGRSKVEDRYRAAVDKRIIEMDRHYPYEYVLSEYDEPLYVIRPDPETETYKVEAIRAHPTGFEVRKPFPDGWRGKRGQELAEVSGVADAVFCHNGGFLAVARSLEGARELAGRAIDA